MPEDEFEITIRNVGAVTNFLFRQNIRAGLEVPLKGFGGTFAIEQGHEGVVPIIAGGIGVTPILAQLNSIDLNRIRLFWAVNVQDVGLVLDTLERCPPLASSTRIFVSAGDKPTAANFGTNIKKLEGYGAHVVTRRILASDLEPDQDLSPTWYLCVGKALRKTCLSWLPDKKTVYEDFDY